MSNVHLREVQVTSQLMEAGEAFMQLAGNKIAREATRAERFDVVVIGAGQAGLSVGYHLAKRGIHFVILDAEARIGDTWRKRWDSLRLFTPARFDSLVGMAFPAHPDTFPTKDEMADYLEAYARRFHLPVRSSSKVQRLFARDGRYVVKTDSAEFEADQIVVAMGSYQAARVPEFAESLNSNIVQLHSSAYKNPGQLSEGPVLLAGAGNSGSEIAMELSRTHQVFMSGRDTGHIPFRINSFLGRLILARLVLRFVFHLLLTIRTPMGRKMRSKVLTQGGPLIRVKPLDLKASGVERVAKVLGARNGLPLLADGRVLDVKNVIWCSGFRAGFSWIDLPIFGAQGELLHEAGIAKDQPGLYFVGLNFLYSMSSGMIHGVGRDAARIVKTISKQRLRSRGTTRARASDLQSATSPVRSPLT